MLFNSICLTLAQVNTFHQNSCKWWKFVAVALVLLSLASQASWWRVWPKQERFWSAVAVVTWDRRRVSRDCAACT